MDCRERGEREREREKSYTVRDSSKLLNCRYIGRKKMATHELLYYSDIDADFVIDDLITVRLLVTSSGFS